MTKTSQILALALIAGSAPWLAGPAAAAPMSQLSTLQDTATLPVETVQFRRWGGGWGGGWRGRGWWGPGVGFGAGALIGGAIAASRPWYGYGYGPSAYGYPYDTYDTYAYEPGYSLGGDDIGYCQQRFRSYDPVSRTYLGYDGLRHPCP